MRRDREIAFPWGKVAHACVSQMRGGRGLQLHTVSRPPLRGLCPAQRMEMNMTAGGSHTSTTLAQRQLRLMRSKLSTITMGWCHIATFDLIRHGLWPVTPSPPGEGFFAPPGDFPVSGTKKSPNRDGWGCKISRGCAFSGYSSENPRCTGSNIPNRGDRGRPGNGPQSRFPPACPAGGSSCRNWPRLPVRSR